MTLSRRAKQIDIAVHPRKRATRELLVGRIRTWTRIRLDPAKTAWFAIFGFCVQRYGSANHRMCFGFVKTSVKIAVLNALNISSLGAGPKCFFVVTAVNAEAQESRISNEVAYTVDTSSTA